MFLIWWLFAAINIAAFILLYKFGMVDLLLDKDLSRLSLVILTLYIIFSAYLGIALKRSKETLKHAIKYATFGSSVLTSLGLLGTIIGLFLIIDSEFVTNIISARQLETKEIIILISTMISGLGTAFLTTITGISTSLLLRLQVFFIKNES